MQLEAGAIGLTCAKLGEAEALVEAGIEASILVANQIIGASKIHRLVQLAESVPEICIAVDDARQIDALDGALRGRAVRIGALIEVDVGMHRCGSDSPEQTLALAQRLCTSRVSYRGLMGYEGHAVLVPDAAQRKAMTEEALRRLEQHHTALCEGGLEPEIVSAGGTGTYEITGAHPIVSEVQAGSYVFMDGAYLKVRTDFEPALTLLTTIVHRRDRLLVTDAGMKALTYEFGMPEGATLPLRCVGLSEEHGHVLLDEDACLQLEPGDRIELLPSHGDTTINLHDRYIVLQEDRVQGSWPIIGRGRFH